MTNRGKLYSDQGGEVRRHGRLTWFAPEDLDADQRRLHEEISSGPRASGGSPFPLTDERGRLEGPFNAMLVHPGIGGAVQALGARIRYGSALSDRERELAILRVAALGHSEFEWYAHQRVGRAVGLSDVEMSGAAAGTAADSLSTAEDTVLDVVTRLVADGDLDDASFAHAEQVLGTRRLADLVALVGYYQLLALSLRVWRTPLPAGEDVTIG
jgi:4-carboxymuconolactone decarboxylase